MYSQLLDRWMGMTWEERRTSARNMPPEIIESFAEALEGEVNMLRLQHQQSIEMRDLTAWQNRRAQEILAFTHESKQG